MFAYRMYTFYIALELMVLISSANLHRSPTKRRSENLESISGSSRSTKRALTTSQVLTFNLTNALILLIMKGILIVAGILGKISFWKYPNLGGIPMVRSVNTSTPMDEIESQIYNSLFSDEDMRWWSTYFWSINKNDLGCLYRLACENRRSAQIYLKGGTILNGAAKSLFSMFKLSTNQRYEHILVGLQSALDTREEDCRRKYSCRAPFDKLKLFSFLQSFG